MDVVHDALEDGAELSFSSQVAVASEQLHAMLRSKEDLNLFRTITLLSGPDRIVHD